MLRIQYTVRFSRCREQIYRVLVALLWIGRGAALGGNARLHFPSGHIPDTVPLPAFTPGSQAGVCCLVSQEWDFWRSMHFPKHGEGSRSPLPALFTQFRFLFCLLSSGAGGEEPDHPAVVLPLPRKSQQM